MHPDVLLSHLSVQEPRDPTRPDRSPDSASTQQALKAAHPTPAILADGVPHSPPEATIDPAGGLAVSGSEHGAPVARPPR